MATAERGANGKFVAKPNIPLGTGGATDNELAGNDESNSGPIKQVAPASLDGKPGESPGDKPASGRGSGRRGRPPGSGNAKTSQTLDISGLESLLFSVHFMLAGMLDAPDFALSEKESETLAKAVGNVARHYDLTANQKTIDWVQLFFAMGTIYGPRLKYITRKRIA